MEGRSSGSNAASVQGTQMRTARVKIHEAGEGNSPVLPGVDCVTTMDLEEQGLDVQTPNV